MRSYYSKDVRKYAEMSYEGKYLLDPKYMTKRDMQHYYSYYNSTKNRSQLKKIIVVVSCICFFSYIFLDYNLKTKLIRLRDRFDFVARIDADFNKTQAYFVDTLGCRMPYFNVTDDNVAQFIVSPRKFRCAKALTRTDDVGSHLWLNMNELEVRERFKSPPKDIPCYYREIRRQPDDGKNVYMAKVPFVLEPNRSVDIAAGIEFINVHCETSHSVYDDFHFFIGDKSANKSQPPPPTNIAFITPAIPESTIGLGPETGHFAKAGHHKAEGGDESAERLSVMVLGLDGVSHLNFLRQMRHTAAYIRHNLSHVEFWGFNKVADNTYPNLMPMLTGLDEKELALSCLGDQLPFVDDCAFIWKRFKEIGYQTAYAEDCANLSLFNFMQNSFLKQPTDYYLQTIMEEMEIHLSTLKSVNINLCTGGRRTYDVLLEMIRKLQPYLSTQDFFSFFWTVSLTHDMLNMPALMDDDLLALLRSMETVGVLNRTVVLLMSDHGMRWGSFRKTYQGMMEERQPLLIPLYPRWLRQKYPTAIANLEVNARRLVTHFDLHATMLDLLDVRSLHEARLAKRAADLAEADTMPRSISLFLPVPVSRTCENAAIAAHWCTCHQRHELATNEPRVQRAARYIVQLINKRLKAHPQCRVLYLNAILEATIAAPHRAIVEAVTDTYSVDITMRLQTKPGLGLFESTVRMSNFSIELTGTISRINLYASQSYCIDNYALKMFCYCHR